jgi:hypothetical protein
MGKTYRRDSDSFDRLRKKSKTNKNDSKKSKFSKTKTHESVESEE